VELTDPQIPKTFVKLAGERLRAVHDRARAWLGGYHEDTFHVDLASARNN